MRRLMASLSLRTSSPSTLPSPSLGASTPHSMRISVDLPLPFGPSNPKIVPRGTSNDTRSTAVRGPNRRVSARATRAGAELVLASRSFLEPSFTEARRHSPDHTSFLEPHVDRHARPQQLLALLERDADAYDDLRALLRGLHVVGCELAARGEEVDVRAEAPAGEGVETHPGRGADREGQAIL